MNNQKQKYIFDGIQALRFLAALMVVVTHSTFYASERLGTGGSTWTSGAKGVDIFFVISGFIMVISARNLIGSANDWKIFLQKRLIRVVPLYWIATTFKVVTLLFLANLVLHAELDWWVIFKSYFFVPSKNIDGEISTFLGVGWTLVFEMFFYIVFTLSLALRKNIYQFVGGVLIFFTLLSFIRGDDYSAWWFLMDQMVLEFYFGMLIGYFTLKGKKIPKNAAIISFFFSLYYLLFSDNLLNLPQILQNGIPATILVWSTISLEANIKGRLPRFVLFFGTASYSLYLFHPLVAPLAPVILNKLSIGSFPISIFFSITIAMIVSAFVYLWIEKPLTNLIRRNQKHVKHSKQNFNRVSKIT
ncbi:MAG: acyltransferase [Chloroflexi bacterium]|nr:MAG: acyltransferase [Chloroflexota bacterium]